MCRLRIYPDRIDLQGVCGEMEYKGEEVNKIIYGLVCLKPCRKCGGRAVMVHEYRRTDRDYHNRYVVRCTECGCESRECYFTEEALKDWNQSIMRD